MNIIHLLPEHGFVLYLLRVNPFLTELIFPINPVEMLVISKLTKD
jgi:hypothetical protein